MAATTISAYADEIEAYRATPSVPIRGNRNTRIHCAAFKLTLASEASGTSFAVAILPKGARIIAGTLAASATLANSATLSVGLAATDGGGLIDDGYAYGEGTSGVTVSDSTTYLKAAAAQGATQVGFALTSALGYGYMLEKECYLTLTTGTGSVTTEVVRGHILYTVD